MNRMYITLKKEQSLDGNFKPLEEPCISVYANVDSISACIAGFTQDEEIDMSFIEPENILKTLEESCSDMEIEEISSVLHCSDYYYFYDKKFNCKDIKGE